MTENDPIFVFVRLKSIILVFEGNILDFCDRLTLLSSTRVSSTRPQNATWNPIHTDVTAQTDDKMCQTQIATIRSLLQ
jgi:hypothetical protein